MSKKLIYTIVAVVGIAAASGAAWWYQSQPQKAQQVMGAPTAGVAAGKATPATLRVAGVEVARVQRVSLQDDAQSVGTLRSRQSVMLRPEVAGRIKALGFRDGARVRKGQLLVQLDDTLQRAELRQAQAQVSIAQATLKRNQELVAENFVAQRVLDESAANVQVVEAQLALAVARLSRMAIVAPFDGTVGIRNVSVGDYVKDGADLVNLEDISSLYVDFRLPERYQGKLRAQQAVELTLDAMPGRTFEGRVEAIDPLLDANGRSVGVRAVVLNALADKRPGMFARVTVLFSVNANALVVPEEAIVPQGDRQFVIKVVAPAGSPATSANAPADTQFVSLRQEVKLGVRRAGQVEITEGLADRETIVVAGQQRLQRDGTPLRIVALDRPAQRAASAPTPSSAAPR